MPTQTKYDNATAAVTKLVQEAESHLPLLVKNLIAQAPPDQVRQFMSAVAKAALDAGNAE